MWKIIFLEREMQERSQSEMKSCYWNTWIIDSDLKCKQEFLWKFDRYHPEKLWADYE